MEKRKVYISSTFRDLNAIREFITRKIEDQNVLGEYYETTYIMEHMRDAGRDGSIQEQCLEALGKADVYILIIGNWYGSCPQGSDKSYTELEFLEAKKRRDIKKYILHSSVKYNQLKLSELNQTCLNANIDIEINNKKVEAFKENSRVTSAIEFDSDEALKDKIVDCLIRDISVLYLEEKFASNSTIKSKRDYLNRDAHRAIFGKKRKELETSKIFPVAIINTSEDAVQCFIDRLKKDYVITDITSEQSLQSRILRSSDYQSGLINYHDNKSPDFESTLLFLESKCDDAFSSNSSIKYLFDSITQKKNNTACTLQFEIGITDIADDSDANNHWLKLIVIFLEQLNKLDKTIIAGIYIFISIKYNSSKDLDAINNNKYLQQIFCLSNIINLDKLSNLKKQDVTNFLRDKVYELSTKTPDSEEYLDIESEYNLIKADIDKVWFSETEFSYYHALKVLGVAK